MENWILRLDDRFVRMEIWNAIYEKRIETSEIQILKVENGIAIQEILSSWVENLTSMSESRPEKGIVAVTLTRQLKVKIETLTLYNTSYHFDWFGFCV